MGHPVGKPGIEEVVTVTVPKDHVITVQRTRYVFVDTFMSQIHRMSLERFGNRSFYIRVKRTFGKHLYNTATIYGMEAIDIDNPHNVVVSAWFKFIVVNSAKDVEPCKYSVVQKKGV